MVVVVVIVIIVVVVIVQGVESIFEERIDMRMMRRGFHHEGSGGSCFQLVAFFASVSVVVAEWQLMLRQ